MGKRGPQPRQLTPTQELELWSWYQAKKALGTFKSKARAMGTTDAVLYHALERLKREKDAEAAIQRRRFMQTLRSMPF